MPRKSFHMYSEHPYHLSARTNGRDWFELDLDQVWEIMSCYLHFAHYAYGVRIHSFVLMTNHFHLLASFPNGNLSEFATYFMRETSRAIGREVGRINHVWGGRVFRSCIASGLHYEHAYKYVYRNPVEAGACEAVEEYRYSTLAGLLGRQHVMIPLDEDPLLFDGDRTNETLRWLNTPVDHVRKEAVRCALRRSIFQLSKREGYSLESERL